MTNKELINQFFDLIEEFGLDEYIYISHDLEIPDNENIFTFIEHYLQTRAKIYLFKKYLLNSTDI